MNFDAFYSDPHFFHTNIIKYADRPFSTVEEMNERLVANYNEMIGPNDTCLWLGDCFFGPYDVGDALIRSMNGKKFLLVGNHDRSLSRMAKSGFMGVTKIINLSIANKKLRACHYPYRYPNAPPYLSNPERKPGEILLHGHVHTRTKFSNDRTMLHVGVDAWDYCPVRYEQIEPLIRETKK